MMVFLISVRKGALPKVFMSEFSISLINPNDLCGVCWHAEDDIVEQKKIPWIECGKCKQWYHVHCLTNPPPDTNLPFTCEFC